MSLKDYCASGHKDRQVEAAAKLLKKENDGLFYCHHCDAAFDYICEPTGTLCFRCEHG